MYEINKQFDRADYTYKYRAKNINNQQLILDIYICDNSDFSNELLWNIEFYIATKRKHGFQTLISTGKDGIKSLIWAKNCIKDFIKEKESDTEYNNSILVNWDNSKRKKIYIYGLSKLGFTLIKYRRSESLYLRINKPKVQGIEDTQFKL